MRQWEKNRLTGFLSRHVAPHASILDVGCGDGDAIQHLVSQGYANVSGTDISEQMVGIVREMGLSALTTDELAKVDTKFDVIVFSHILEHIGPDRIQETMESYLKRLNPGGKVVVIGPVAYDAFFNDIDHVKPYFPSGLTMLFSQEQFSKQYQSEFTLRLLDVRYRKQSLLPYHLRSLHVKNFTNRLIAAGLSRAFGFLRVISLGLLSKTTGFAAVFEVNRHPAKEERMTRLGVS